MECKIYVDGMQLEHVSEFKYLGYVLDESGTDEAVCRRNAASGMRVRSAISSLVTTRTLQLEYARVLHLRLCLCLFICIAMRE